MKNREPVHLSAQAPVFLLFYLIQQHLIVPLSDMPSGTL